MSVSLRSLLCALAIVAALAPSNATACDEAERLRLSDELNALAQKNAWSGVERKYMELKRTKCELRYEHHMIGADSAKNLGKTYEIFERLKAANELEAQPEVEASIAAIQDNYGRVEIRGDARRRAPLLRDEMPFAPDQRKSIEYAQSVMEGTGSFKGMLPLGPYKVADQEFYVEARGDWQVVTVGKGKVVAGSGEGPQISDQGLINWIGPVAFVGTGFIGSGAPNKPWYNDAIIDEPSVVQNGFCNNTPERVITLDNGEYACTSEIQPSDLAMFQTPNLDLTVGGEVGLTYRAPEAGVAATVSYRRMFGRTSSLNQLTFWGAAVVRPGDLRIAVGPTYGMVFGAGNGYAVFDDGVNEVFRHPRQETARYSGFGLGGGVAGSVGYGLLDLDPLQGLIEVQGHFQSDGKRSYSGIGIRVGVVPKIQRFKG